MTERVHFSEILTYNEKGIKYVPMGEDLLVFREKGKIVSIKDNFMVLDIPVIGENLYDGCYVNIGGNYGIVKCIDSVVGEKINLEMYLVFGSTTQPLKDVVYACYSQDIIICDVDGRNSANAYLQNVLYQRWDDVNKQVCRRGFPEKGEYVKLIPYNMPTDTMESKRVEYIGIWGESPNDWSKPITMPFIASKTGPSRQFNSYMGDLKNTIIVPCNEEEISLINNLLNGAGYTFVEELEEIRPLKRRAEYEKEYYYIDCVGDIECTTDKHSVEDEYQYASGNYFLDIDDAVKARDEMKKILFQF
jgi:hypothetical protein